MSVRKSSVDPHKRGAPKKSPDPKPIAPFETNSAKAVEQAFNRVTGESVCASQLKTFAEGLAQYHLSSEDKFENGGFLDQGQTQRRHINAESFVLIGKEANKVGESGGKRNRIHPDKLRWSPTNEFVSAFDPKRT